MGTMLYARGVFINQCYDELNVRSPALVRGVHDEYVQAGAEVLETNSFGANRAKLAQYGLESQVADLNRRAAQLAREAAGEDRLVAGAVGPLGLRIEPYGPTSRDEARAMFREQMAALAAGGADCFVIETFADLDEMEQAILAARDDDRGRRAHALRRTARGDRPRAGSVRRRHHRAELLGGPADDPGRDRTHG